MPGHYFLVLPDFTIFTWPSCETAGKALCDWSNYSTRPHSTAFRTLLSFSKWSVYFFFILLSTRDAVYEFFWRFSFFGGFNSATVHQSRSHLCPFKTLVSIIKSHFFWQLSFSIHEKLYKFFSSNWCFTKNAKQYFYLLIITKIK